MEQLQYHVLPLGRKLQLQILLHSHPKKSHLKFMQSIHQNQNYINIVLLKHSQHLEKYQL
jgi:hypothetical protein